MMTHRVVIEDEAEREFTETVDFYDQREPGVGQRLADDLLAFFRVICEDPERFPLVTRLTRKAKLPQPWPHSVYFTIRRETSDVVISTIWHGSRNPAELSRRLR
jgi:plasmid stabilization system protein ParE